MKAAEYATAAHKSLARAKDALTAGFPGSARLYIVRARQWWALFLKSGKVFSVAARRTRGTEGSPRWRPMIHVKGSDMSLCFSMKTYAHRQSADRAANKAAATLFA